VGKVLSFRCLDDPRCVLTRSFGMTNIEAVANAPPLALAAPRDREGGIFGVAGVAVGLASLALAPPWPASDASESVIRQYFAEHGAGFLWQCIVLSAGFVILARFYAGLALSVARAGAEALGWTALAGVATTTVAIIVGNAPWAVIAYRAPSEAGLLLLLWDLGLIAAFTVASPCIAAMWLALGLGILRTGTLPATYGYALLAAATVHLGAGACVARSGIFSPNGAVGLGCILVHVVCTLVGAVLLLRAPATVRRGSV